MKKLYPQQEDVVLKLRDGFKAKHTRQMLAAPCGFGKSVVASHIIHSAAAKGNKTLFIVDRICLVEQAAEHLRGMGVHVGILQADNTCLSVRDEVVVASIHTLASKRHRHVPPAKLIVIDEAHILHKAHIDLMNRWNNVPVIGMSATPLRNDLGKYFTNLVRGPSIQWLIDNGFLTPVRAFCPSPDVLDEAIGGVKIRSGDFAEGDLAKAMNSRELVGDIVETWKQRGEGRPTLCFAVDIAHSKAIVEEFFMAGVSAAHMDAYTDADERKGIISRFKHGEIDVLSSVNVLGIGFDYPGASCAILARPTMSQALYMQQIGRVMRTCEGKEDAIILDHSGNTLRFDLPENFIVPDLGDGTTPKNAEKPKPTDKKQSTCKHIIPPHSKPCGAVLPPGTLTCPSCGMDRDVKKSNVTYIDGELVAYGSKADGKKKEETTPLEWYLGLRWHGGMKGYSDGWAYHKFKRRFDMEPEAVWKKLEPIPPKPNIARWITSEQIRYAKGRKKAQGQLKYG